MISINYRKYTDIMIGALICVGISMIISLMIKGSMYPWYTTLTKASFNPPSWVFAPVWTILYLMKGTIFALLLRDVRQYKYPLITFSLQYILNIIWSPLFFYLHRIDLALYDLFMMVILTILFILQIKNEKVLLYLSLPYLVWISFAMILNFNIYILN